MEESKYGYFTFENSNNKEKYLFGGYIEKIKVKLIKEYCDEKYIKEISIDELKDMFKRAISDFTNAFFGKKFPITIFDSYDYMKYISSDCIRIIDKIESNGCDFAYFQMEVYLKNKRETKILTITKSMKENKIFNTLNKLTLLTEHQKESRCYDIIKIYSDDNNYTNSNIIELAIYIDEKDNKFVLGIYRDGVIVQQSYSPRVIQFIIENDLDIIDPIFFHKYSLNKREEVKHVSNMCDDIDDCMEETLPVAKKKSVTKKI